MDNVRHTLAFLLDQKWRMKLEQYCAYRFFLPDVHISCIVCRVVYFKNVQFINTHALYNYPVNKTSKIIIFLKIIKTLLTKSKVQLIV